VGDEIKKSPNKIRRGKKAKTGGRRHLESPMKGRLVKRELKSRKFEAWGSRGFIGFCKILLKKKVKKSNSKSPVNSGEKPEKGRSEFLEGVSLVSFSNGTLSEKGPSRGKKKGNKKRTLGRR